MLLSVKIPIVSLCSVYLWQISLLFYTFVCHYNRLEIKVQTLESLNKMFNEIINTTVFSNKKLNKKKLDKKKKIRRNHSRPRVKCLLECSLLHFMLLSTLFCGFGHRFSSTSCALLQCVLLKALNK